MYWPAWKHQCHTQCFLHTTPENDVFRTEGRAMKPCNWSSSSYLLLTRCTTHPITCQANKVVKQVLFKLFTELSDNIHICFYTHSVRICSTFHWSSVTLNCLKCSNWGVVSFLVFRQYNSTKVTNHKIFIYIFNSK